MTLVTAHLDVRAFPTWERHPRVFAAFDALPIGGTLELTSDHEPRPLRYEFDEQRADAFVWDHQMLDEDRWRVTIKRVPKEPVLTDLGSFLRHCSVFSDLDDDARRALAAAGIERTLDSGGVLIEQGQRLGACVLVRTGVLAAIASSEDGREQLLYEALPFETCGEIELFDDGGFCARLVASYGSARVVLLPRAIVFETAHRFPMFGLRLGMRAAVRGRTLGERLMHIAFSSTTARIARALLPYAAPAAGMAPTLPPLSEMSQTHIATIAGTVRIVVARGLAKLVKERAIELRRGKVSHIDRQRLELLCN